MTVPCDQCGADDQPEDRTATIAAAAFRPAAMLRKSRPKRSRRTCLQGMRADAHDARPHPAVGSLFARLHKKIEAAPGPILPAGAVLQQAGATARLFEDVETFVEFLDVLKALFIHLERIHLARTSMWRSRLPSVAAIFLADLFGGAPAVGVVVAPNHRNIVDSLGWVNAMGRPHRVCAKPRTWKWNGALTTLGSPPGVRWSKPRNPLALGMSPPLSATGIA